MNGDIPERDWKKLKSIKDQALETACERILERVQSLIKSRDDGSHKTYLKLWRLMEDEDEQISLMFDDVKRSTGLYKLGVWKLNGILSQKDFDDLSKETQQRVKAFCDING